MSVNQQCTINSSTLLCTLQIADSLFPIGSFTQSYGLETYVQEGRICSATSLKDFMTTYVHYMLGYTDCLAACLAYKYASDDNFDSIVKLDQIITALKASREVREASLRIGKMMLKTVEQLFGCPLIERYSTVVNKGIAQGHHAVIFGLVARSIGLSPIQTNIVFLYNAAASMVNAAIKLIPLGQREGQGVLFSLHPTIMETAHKVLSLEERNLGAFAPALEIRCMAHERLYTRLFMS